MKALIAAGEPIWTIHNPMPDAPPLHGDTAADVCIVGAGIAGLSTAYELIRRGKSVVVIDDGPLAGGQTTVTTAHLSNEIDDRYSEVERIRGERIARLAAQSHTAAIDAIEANIRREHIQCNFDRVDGFLFLHPEQNASVLEKEFEAARRTGIVEVEWAERPPVALYDGPCLRFLKQGQFHPLKYLAGLAEAITRRGGKLYSTTRAKQVEGGEPARVRTENGATITAQAVVVATNTPMNDRVAIHTKQAPYRSYVIGGRVPAGSVPRALYWDTLDPYHYARVQPDETNDTEVLIVGGEDHKTGQADDQDERFARLEAWTRERFPVREFTFHWSGQVMETLDGLGFIGRNPLDAENVFIATGDSGMGMTHGALAGLLLADLIEGKENPWAEAYEPSRKPAKALGDFLSENANVALQYTSWATPGEIRSVEDLQPGEGAILRRGAQKLAVYRDDKGRVHELSAVCPHLQCIVAWNKAERAWDCPCHGSIFSAEGKLINGPANSDLPPATQTQSDG